MFLKHQPEKSLSQFIKNVEAFSGEMDSSFKKNTFAQKINSKKIGGKPKIAVNIFLFKKNKTKTFYSVPWRHFYSKEIVFHAKAKL